MKYPQWHIHSTHFIKMGTGNKSGKFSGIHFHYSFTSDGISSFGSLGKCWFVCVYFWIQLIWLDFGHDQTTHRKKICVPDKNFTLIKLNLRRLMAQWDKIADEPFVLIRRTS